VVVELKAVSLLLRILRPNGEKHGGPAKYTQREHAFFFKTLAVTNLWSQ
jgi:hypothetical protein